MKLSEKVVWPLAGHYLVAVSGGVDSMALLNLLAAQAKSRKLQLEVAHFNHGWTEAAVGYEAVVKASAKKYDLPFHKGSGEVAVNEAAAREARYTWLREVMHSTRATAIVAAHHHDDLIETVVLNLQRGTGRRGLTPFGSAPDVLRPLVGVSKAELIEYVQDRQLQWIEDATNTDTRFRRNEVRTKLLPRLRKENSGFDERLDEVIEEAAKLNPAIDVALTGQITKGEGRASVSTESLRRMPLATLTETLVMMANTARPGTELAGRTVEALAVDIKTGRFRSHRELTKRLFASRARDTVSIAFTP